MLCLANPSTSATYYRLSPFPPLKSKKYELTANQLDEGMIVSVSGNEGVIHNLQIVCLDVAEHRQNDVKRNSMIDSDEIATSTTGNKTV